MANKPVKKTNYSNRYDTKQRKEIALHYVQSESLTGTAKKFGCAVNTVKKFVEEHKGLVDKAQKSKDVSIDNFIEAMIKDASKAYSVSDLYVEELKNPKKIKAASSKEAATVYGILVDKQLRLEEVRIKRLEAELKKKEIAAMEKGVSINIMPQMSSYGKRDKNE